ncbi:MAG: PAS domain-containing sensor histidine kinase [Deltaproteobacteria bacterium]
MIHEMLCGYALHEIIRDESGKPYDYRFLDINPAFERMTGKKAEEIIGKRAREVFPKLERYWIDTYGKVALGGPPVHFESYNRDLDKHLDVTAFSNEFGRFSVIFYDITERVEASEDLQNSAEKLKLFAFSVAHDLRNPAVSIQGLCRRLENKYLPGDHPQARQICRQLSNSADQIVALTDRIHQYIAAKEAPLNFESLDLGTICKSIKEEFSDRLEKQRVQCHISEAAQQIVADRLSVLRIIRNLVDNSLKYGGPGLSKIAVHVRNEAAHHVICVTDNGKGLGKEANDKLFHFFTRQEKEPSTEGLGLGLAIVKEISEQHGGNVWVENHPTANGSTFCFSISKDLKACTCGTP